MKTDMELKRDVENELKWEPSVNEAHIGVTARDGVITLTGHVPAYAEKYVAEKTAKRVYGVKAVADELEVKLPGSSRRSDEDIATACVAALRANYTVPYDNVKVVVNKGWVTLDGEVERYFQKQNAHYAVRYLTGVVGVSNDIRIKLSVSPTDIKKNIEAAFVRSAEIDARRISVDAHDGKVTLSGNVRSWGEYNEAQRAASAAPGVIGIENKLTVIP